MPSPVDRNAPSLSGYLSGTMLMTGAGMTPVDWIGVGDRVMTADHGWQMVRWRGHREFRHGRGLPAPIEIAAGALGPGRPAAALRIAPGQRVVIAGAQVELHFGEVEVLVAAEDLLGLPGVTSVLPELDHAYHQLLFDRREVLIAEGIEVESLVLGEVEAMAGPALIPAPPDGLARTVRHLHGGAARLCLETHEALILAPPRRRTRAEQRPIGHSAAA